MKSRINCVMKQSSNIKKILNFCNDITRITVANVRALHSKNKSQSYIHNTCKTPLQFNTIGDILENASNKWPERLAIISKAENITLTFSELLVQADQLAAALIELGMQSGDRIGIWSPNSTQWIVTMMAAARAGLILVAINPAYQQSEIKFCINKTEIKAMISPGTFKTQNYYQMLLNLAPELAKSKPGHLQSKELPSLRSVIIVSNSNLPGTLSYDKLMFSANSQNIQNIAKIQSLIQPDEGCNIQMTSGTTGDPKAALLSHFNMVNNSYFIGVRNELANVHQKICVQIPLFHVFGVNITICASLHHGATMVLPSAGYSPSHSAEAILSEKCTIIHGTPTMYIDLLKIQQEKGFEFLTPQVAVSGGSPCSPHLFMQMLKKLKVKSVKSVFGMTEGTAVGFQSMPGEAMEKATDTVGHVQEHLEAKVVDINGKIVPFGVPGELQMRGYSTMLEYWNDAKKTQDTIGADKWLRTGDQFSLSEDGYGRIVGRIKDMIIRGGENIYPKEIEDFLNTHPDILECHVFGVEDERLGEEVCAAVRVRDSSITLTQPMIKAFCDTKISHYKIPKLLKVVESFPKTESGKIQKFKLKQLVESGKL